MPRRQAVREMKQTFHAGMAVCANDEKRLHAMEAALSLLERSVRMGHRRLAVIRLKTAVSAGVPVPDEFWRYCYEAAAASKDEAIQNLYLESVVAGMATTTKLTKRH